MRYARSGWFHTLRERDSNGYLVSNKPDEDDARFDSRVEPLLSITFFRRLGWCTKLSTAEPSGTSVPGFNLGQLKEIPVRLPPLAIQQDISRALRSFDDLIENNRQRIKILEEIARLLYREWFVDFRFPGHEDVELVSSDFGLIPEGLDYARLSDLVSTQYGYTESASLDQVGPRFLRGMDINKTSFIDWSFVPFCPVSEFDRQKFAVQVGDVFVIRMADPVQGRHLRTGDRRCLRFVSGEVAANQQSDHSILSPSSLLTIITIRCGSVAPARVQLGRASVPR